MAHQHYIPVTVFCEYNSIEVSFVNTLYELNLVEVVEMDNELFLPAETLHDAERVVRLHNELNINAEGLHAVLHLLDKMKQMQQEIGHLKNRLRIYGE